MIDLKAAAKAATDKYAYVTDRPTAIAIAAFTIYGAGSATVDAVNKIQQIRANRKAHKAAAKVVETAIPQQ